MNNQNLDGKAAFNNKIPLHKNPFPTLDHRHHLWNQSWYSAQEELLNYNSIEEYT